MRVRVGVCAVELAAQLEGKATELAEALSTAKATEDRSKEALNEMTVRLFIYQDRLHGQPIISQDRLGDMLVHKNARVKTVVRRWRPPQ